jgi:hypothetical protein
MPEETPTPPSTPPAEPFFSVTPAPATPFNIGEEYGTAKKNLPPVKVVVIPLLVIGAIALTVALLQRPKLSATGSIDDISYAEVPGQSMVMAAINISVRNQGEKTFSIQSMEVAIDTAAGQFTDDAAPIVDVDRYLTALPSLKQHALTPISREIQIAPGAETKGTMVVSFPITPDAFANRKSLKVTIKAHDQPVALVLTK